MGSKRQAHYNKGKLNKIAFVFSCPGQEEAINGKPVFGQTGRNLEIVLRTLEKKGIIKNFQSRYDFRITNAYSGIFFKEKDGRSEATLREIYGHENLKRLHHELKDISDVIICFGVKANKAIQKINSISKMKLKAKIIVSRHLGLSSLNQIKIEDCINKTDGRLNIVAERIANEFPVS